MAQTNRNPRSMVNKFDSTCGDCGRPIAKGETILYHGKGYAQCNDCAPVNTTPAQPAKAQSWQDALAWDDSAPDAGASIGGTATATRPKLEKADYVTQKVNKVHYLNDNECEHCGIVAELSHHDATGQALCIDCEKHHDQLADTGQQIIEQAQAKATNQQWKGDDQTRRLEAAKVDPLDDISATDRAEALTTELLLILVNAIDVAGISGRHSLQAFCKQNASRSIDMSTRQHLWHGIGQAIQKA